MDDLLKNLFEQKVFLIFYGLLGYYLILWSIARNKVSRAKKAMLKVSDNPAETDLILKDKRYHFNFKEWYNDQKDEMLVALFFSLLLIEFDDVALDIINKNISTPMEAGNWIYLCGGIMGDLLYRGYQKMIG